MNVEERAKATLATRGYVVLKEKSYRQAQERQRVADAYRHAAEQDAEHARAWARDCLTEERRLRERLTFVYGMARSYGASVEELRDPDITERAPAFRVRPFLADYVFCRTCVTTHIPTIPSVTFMCAGCGFGAWDDAIAERHAEVLPDHIVYPCCHETVPV